MVASIVYNNHPHAVVELYVHVDRLWNLVKGKCAFHTKLAAEGLVLRVPPPSDPVSGQRYALLTAKQLSVHELEAAEGSTVASWELPAASQCMAWCGRGGGAVMVVGSDDGGLRCFDQRVGSTPASGLPAAHAVRCRWGGRCVVVRAPP